MRALRAFLSKYRIPVMLTGHSHSTCLDAIRFATHTTLEARCGTTTQIDLLTAELTGRVFLGTELNFHLRKRRDVNSLLIHQVVPSGDGLEWVTRDYVRTPLGFERGAGMKTVPL